MARIGSIDINKVAGLGDKLVGLGKEAVGTLLGNDRLSEEGEAQQAKGTERLRALKAEAKAERHEAKAALHEKQQKVAQKVKESA